MSAVKEKKYQIVVTGQQPDTAALVPVAPHVYYVRAENAEDARKQAQSVFLDAYPDAVNVSAEKETGKYGLPILFLSLACFIGWIPWHGNGVVISLKPSLISALAAIGMYSAVIMRIKGFANSFNGFAETVLNLLLMTFCASFLNLFCGDMTIQIFSGVTVSGKVLLLAGIVLSWIGIRKIAGFVWIALFILAVLRLLVADAAMGVWGVIYAFSAFLGIVFWLKQERNTFRIALGEKLTSISATTHRRVVGDIKNGR